MDADELEKDLAELRELEKLAKRPKIQRLLSQEAKKLETERTSRLGAGDQMTSSTTAKKQFVQTGHESPIVPLVKLTTYAWDQSDKFVKIYLTVPKIESITNEQVLADFQKKSFEITAKNVNGTDYQLSIKGLLQEIVPEQSSFKIKKDTLLINLHKLKQKQNWAYVTEMEQRSKDKQLDGVKPPGPAGDSEDPQAGLMHMMKQMYDSGDDEMKRTIKKAWFEAQEKKKTGGGVPGAGGLMDEGDF